MAFEEKQNRPDKVVVAEVETLKEDGQARGTVEEVSVGAAGLRMPNHGADQCPSEASHSSSDCPPDMAAQDSLVLDSSTKGFSQNVGVPPASAPEAAPAPKKEDPKSASSPEKVWKDDADSRTAARPEGRPVMWIDSVKGRPVLSATEGSVPKADPGLIAKHSKGASSLERVPLVKALAALQGSAREEPVLISGLAEAKQNSRRVNGLYVRTGRTIRGGRPVYKKWGAGKPTHLFFSTDKSSWRITQDLDSKGVFAKNHDKDASKPFLVQKTWKVFDGHHCIDDKDVRAYVIDINHPPAGVELVCAAIHSAAEEVNAESDSTVSKKKRAGLNVANEVKDKPESKRARHDKSNAADGAELESTSVKAQGGMSAKNVEDKSASKNAGHEKSDAADGAKSESMSTEGQHGMSNADEGADTERTPKRGRTAKLDIAEDRNIKRRVIPVGQTCVVRVKRAVGACALFNMLDKKQILQVTRQQTKGSFNEVRGIAEVLCALINRGATVEEVQAKKKLLIRATNRESPVKEAKPKKPTLQEQPSMKPVAKMKAKAKPASSSSSSSSSSSDSDSDSAAGNMKPKPATPRAAARTSTNPRPTEVALGSIEMARRAQEEQRYRSLLAEFNEKKAALG